MESSWKGFVEGGLAATIAGCATHPLDLIKVRMQLQGEVQMATAQPLPASLSWALDGGRSRVTAAAVIAARPNNNPLSVVTSLVQSEGVRGLYSGVSATILRQLLYSSTRMGLYEYLKNAWRREEEGSGGLSLSKKVTAALVSGAVGAAVGNPADLAMVRMQADGRLPMSERRNYTGVGNALMRMVRQDGLLSLWTGAAPTITRAMLVTAAQLASYDQIKDTITQHHLAPEGFATQVLSSCGAGLLAAVASNPIDVVKTRVMNMKVAEVAAAGHGGETAATAAAGGTLAPPPYKGALDCAIKTVRAEGPMALYKGFVPTVTRQGPFAIVMFLSLEQIREVFEHL